MSAKQTTPPQTKKSVSAGVVFKRRPGKTKKLDMTLQPAFHAPYLTTEDVSDDHEHTGKLRSSSRTRQKDKRRRSRKRSHEHPIAIEFKEASDDYKRHLYSKATSEINKTLEDLLCQLHESTMQNMPSGKPDETPPLKLSKPAQYERMATALYRPLSVYRLGLTRTNTDGEKTRVENTLGDRIGNFDEHIQRQTREFKQLQMNWEVVVGEIFKLGIVCLGQGTMETLFSATENTPSPPKPAYGGADADMDAESTLFVLEQDSPPRGKKKRVTFEASFPPFLYQPSRLKKPSPETPILPEEKVKTLEGQIGELGREHLRQLREIEDIHAAWLKKKHALIAQAMLTED